MREKVLFFLIWGLAALGREALSNEEPPFCAFCDPLVLQQVYYEDEVAAVLLTHRPIFPGHSVILPKRHVLAFHELTSEELVHIHELLKLVHQVMVELYGAEPYLIVQKNYLPWQSVPHVHFHYLPIREEDAGICNVLYQVAWSSWWKSADTLEEMKPVLDSLKKAMNAQSRRKAS